VSEENREIKDLTEYTNEELYEHGTMLEVVTPLENELLRRLEYYIQQYGDYLGSYSPEADI
tara:strand:+ start:1047 stop:1229 length:183 start_codon:yes stop_codon:yes gene_type:complete